MQCGEWVFPLVPGKSPVLKAADTTYMFPELQGDGELIILKDFVNYCVTICVISTVQLCNILPSSYVTFCKCYFRWLFSWADIGGG